MLKKKMKKTRQIPLTIKLENKNLMPIKTLCYVSLIKPKNCTSLVNLLNKGEMAGENGKQLTIHALHRKSKKISPTAVCRYLYQ